MNPPSSSLKMIDSRFRGNDIKGGGNDMKENGDDKRSLSPILNRKVLGCELYI